MNLSSIMPGNLVEFSLLECYELIMDLFYSPLPVPFSFFRLKLKVIVLYLW